MGVKTNGVHVITKFTKMYESCAPRPVPVTVISLTGVSSRSIFCNIKGLTLQNKMPLPSTLSPSHSNSFLETGTFPRFNSSIQRTLYCPSRTGRALRYNEWAQCPIASCPTFISSTRRNQFSLYPPETAALAGCIFTSVLLLV